MKNPVFRYTITFCFLFVMFSIFTGCSTVTQQPQQPQRLQQPSKVQTPVVEIQTVEQINFTPDATHQKIAELKDAFKVYNTAKGRATGVYEYNGLVYVIVNVDYGKEKINRRLAKGTAMLRAKKMLQNTYKLHSGFNLRSHQLEARDIYQQKIYRYAIVFRKSDINAHDSGQTVFPESAVMNKTAAVPAKTTVKNTGTRHEDLKKEYNLQNKKSMPKQQISEVNKKKSNITTKRSVPEVKRKSTQFQGGAFSGDKDVDDDF